MSYSIAYVFLWKIILNMSVPHPIINGVTFTKKFSIYNTCPSELNYNSVKFDFNEDEFI